jgi:hypothetical protein
MLGVPYGRVFRCKSSWRLWRHCGLSASTPHAIAGNFLNAKQLIEHNEHQGYTKNIMFSQLLNYRLFTFEIIHYLFNNNFT